MHHVTTTYNSPQRAVIKPFAWSYSRLKNFESCPKKHYHVDIAKDCKEEEGEQLKWGNMLHAAAAKRISKGIPLPAGMEMLEPWCVKVLGSGADGEGKVSTEQKLAITREFGPCEYFAKNAWFRGVADVLKIMGPVALAIDWKTGKIVEDSVQLALMAACIFAHYPELQRIRTLFVWLAHDAETKADFSREDMVGLWRGLWPRIEQLEHAHNTVSYPPKPGGLCKRYCPVEACPHHGVGNY